MSASRATSAHTGVSAHRAPSARSPRTECSHSRECSPCTKRSPCTECSHWCECSPGARTHVSAHHAPPSAHTDVSAHRVQPSALLKASARLELGPLCQKVQGMNTRLPATQGSSRLSLGVCPREIVSALGLGVQLSINKSTLSSKKRSALARLASCQEWS